MVNEEFLNGFNFIKAGEIKVNGGYVLKYISELKRNNQPGVYLWCKREEDGANLEVKYVGKAGNGVTARMGQHIGGLSRPSARERAEFIREQFGAKNKMEDCLEVWFRITPKVSILDIFQSNKYSKFSHDSKIFNPNVEVSQYSLEEEALITYFEPILNRAKTPTLRDQDKAKSHKSNVMKFEDLDQIMCEANGEQRDGWTNAIQYITDIHKRKIAKVLDLILKLLASQSSDANSWPTDLKFIASDSRTKLAGQPLLVLGEIKNGNKIFTRGSKIVLISLEKENENIYFFGKIKEILPENLNKTDGCDLTYCIKELSKINYKEPRLRS